MNRLINVVATQDFTIFPNEMINVPVILSEELPQEYTALVSPSPGIPLRLRVSNPTVFTTKFDVSVANFGDGPYWDGITGDLNGDLYDMQDELLPKGFFGKDDRYSIPYDIKTGDVIAIAEVVKNGK